MIMTLHLNIIYGRILFINQFCLSNNNKTRQNSCDLYSHHNITIYQMKTIDKNNKTKIVKWSLPWLERKTEKKMFTSSFFFTIAFDPWWWWIWIEKKCWLCHSHVCVCVWLLNCVQYNRYNFFCCYSAINNTI